MRVADRDTQKEYLISDILRHWYHDGWVYLAELESVVTGSFVKVIWANIDCRCLDETDFMYNKFSIFDN